MIHRTRSLRSGLSYKFRMKYFPKTIPSHLGLSSILKVHSFASQRRLDARRCSWPKQKKRQACRCLGLFIWRYVEPSNGLSPQLFHSPIVYTSPYLLHGHHCIFCSVLEKKKDPRVKKKLYFFSRKFHFHSVSQPSFFATLSPPFNSTTPS